MSALDRLAGERHILLTTFRRDGRAVATPVWAVRDGAALAVWTAADSGKVKRIRRDGTVTVAPCDIRGRPRGDAVAGRATVAGPADKRLRALMAGKYGLVARISMLASRIRRGQTGAVRLLITPEP
jgi:hypothetical protein